jgi:hypothetical protein
MPALLLMKWLPLPVTLVILTSVRAFTAPVATPEALVAAVRDGAEDAVIEIAAGTHELAGPLEPKPGMTLKGAGMEKTILTAKAGWKPPVTTLPDSGMKTEGMDTRAYLIRLQDKATKDHGNPISGFGQAAAGGPALFRNNLVNNPGRDVIWINEPYVNLVVRNNHIIARRTATPRIEGRFGFAAACDFKSFRFEDNIIECRDQDRPLFRNDESGRSTVVNNRLTGISDTARYENRRTQAEPGLKEPLKFACGVHGEVLVDGWEAKPAKR